MACTMQRGYAGKSKVRHETNVFISCPPLVVELLWSGIRAVDCERKNYKILFTSLPGSVCRRQFCRATSDVMCKLVKVRSLDSVPFSRYSVL